MTDDPRRAGLERFITRPGANETPEQLSARLFAGELLVYSGLEPVQELVLRTRDMIKESFGTSNPQEAESVLPVEEFQRRVTLGRRLISNDEVIDRCWETLLQGLGYMSQVTYRDRVRLRVVPSGKQACNRIARPLQTHRDTWGSGIMSQINWWLPLYPLTASRTMLVWPQYFQTPVANNSADWDYHALLNDSSRSYPLLPVAWERPSQPGLPVLIEPGELLVFSAAHLHAGCSDDSGLTRFSLDTRSVWGDDVSAKRGAENVDGVNDRAHWDMFIRPDRPDTGALQGYTR